MGLVSHPRRATPTPRPCRRVRWTCCAATRQRAKAKLAQIGNEPAGTRRYHPLPPSPSWRRRCGERFKGSIANTCLVRDCEIVYADTRLPGPRARRRPAPPARGRPAARGPAPSGCTPPGELVGSDPQRRLDQGRQCIKSSLHIRCSQRGRRLTPAAQPRAWAIRTATYAPATPLPPQATVRTPLPARSCEPND